MVVRDVAVQRAVCCNNALLLLLQLASAEWCHQAARCRLVRQLSAVPPEALEVLLHWDCFKVISCSSPPKMFSGCSAQ
jgi:hypothetical protein